MCGLNGIYAYGPVAPQPDLVELTRTRDAMAARGPDGAMNWQSADLRVALGHRRLAIIDVSERGLQPMTSADGRFVIVYNGEIYNFPALRRELEAGGVVFRSGSDTEALLHLYAQSGPAMLTKLRGAFVFAIYDTVERRLCLARDAYGNKPLYVADDGKTFRFASQVKALLAGGGIASAPDPAGLAGFWLWGSVPDPFTLNRHISALPAGHFQIVDAGGAQKPRAYENLAAVLAEGARQSRPAKHVEARVRDAAKDSVAAHLLADVEVGVFLSSGIDSCAILGLMRDAGQEKIRAVTLAFEDFRGTAEDETPLAAVAAARYGAAQDVSILSRDAIEADVPAIRAAMDQPSIDGVNTWFVAKAARAAGLKVALSGLGGDELFAGYPSFHDVPRMVRLMGLPARIPGLPQALARILRGTRMAARQPKLPFLAAYGGSWPGAYLLRRGLFLPPELPALMDPSVLKEGLARLQWLERVEASMTPDPGAALTRVTALESANYMRHQLLRDADWAGMAHSVEIRTPFADVDLLRALAPDIPHFGQGRGKRALAAAPSLPLDTRWTARPKTGFVVPPVYRGLEAAKAMSKGAWSRNWAQDIIRHAASAP